MTSASPSSETAVPQPVPEARVTQAQSELNSLPQQQPPLSHSCWLHGTQPGPGQVSVIASQTALAQIGTHGSSNLNAELGGALLGHAYRHEERVFVEVKAALAAVTGDHGPVHFTFTADSWAQLHQDRASQYPDLDIVGWFHTHPNLGVFYSGDDVVVHSAAFTLPWHVGLVVDPVRDEACFFGWVDGTLTPFDGFYERHEDQAESAVSWKVVRTSVWQNSYDPDEPFAAGNQVYTPTNNRPALRPMAAPLGLLAGALGLLLGFFLLVGWVIPLNRQVDRLQSVVLMLADEAGVNVAACPDPRLRILGPLTGSRVRVGTAVSVTGTADTPNATRYRVEVRPAGSDAWTLVDVRRRHTALGQLAEWDTAEHSPLPYELRVTAVDKNNVILGGTAVCTVEIELVP